MSEIGLYSEIYKVKKIKALFTRAIQKVFVLLLWPNLARLKVFMFTRGLMGVGALVRIEMFVCKPWPNPKNGEYQVLVEIPVTVGTLFLVE